MATATTYQTPEGKTATGYIIDGRTYKDALGKERVEMGSVVDTADGRYILTPTGGVKTLDNVGAGIASAYQAGGQNLANGLKTTKRSINLATRRKQQRIKEQKAAAQQRYEDANRSAYRAYVSASNPYGAAEEQRARIGLSNSGFAESSKVNLANAYQTALSDNARSKTEYLNELENARIDAEYEGNIALAEAIAQYENLVYKHGIAAAEAIADAETRSYQAGVDMLESNRRAAAEQKNAEDKRNREMLNWATTMARQGLSNREIASYLGISTSELSRLIMGV